MSVPVSSTPAAWRDAMARATPICAACSSASPAKVCARLIAVFMVYPLFQLKDRKLRCASVAVGADGIAENFELLHDQCLQGTRGADGPGLDRGILTAAHDRQLRAANLGDRVAVGGIAVHRCSFMFTTIYSVVGK